MSVGRPRWTWRSTCSTACWSWDGRITSASPDPDGVEGSAAAPMIRAPRWRLLTARYRRCRAPTHPGEGRRELDRSDERNHRRRADEHKYPPSTAPQDDGVPL